MNLICISFVLILLTLIYGHKYLSSYEWKKIRNILSNVQTNHDDQVKIKKVIFDKYKYRTYHKAKEFKLLNKHVTQKISVSNLSYSALVGLVNAINNFDSEQSVNFARFSDKFIFDNLINYVITLQQNYTKLENYVKSENCTKLEHYTNPDKHHLDIRKWYEPYWSCIDNELSEPTKQILNLKFSQSFDKIRSNFEIAKIMNCSESEVNDQIIESTQFIGKKVKKVYDQGCEIFIYKTNKI